MPAIRALAPTLLAKPEHVHAATWNMYFFPTGTCTTRTLEDVHLPP